MSFAIDAVEIPVWIAGAYTHRDVKDVIILLREQLSARNQWRPVVRFSEELARSENEGEGYEYGDAHEVPETNYQSKEGPAVHDYLWR